ncbi:MAG: DNA replication/repair protein RecF [Ruminococcaceae bacterium]|nr:DNA replication/repair protein RecF [Oscillospiraceae bacterium]
MVCNYIKVKNLRNIDEGEIFFDKGVNVLVGNNAQGKTNLLEGIYSFALGRSFRGAKEAEVIKFGENEARTEIGFTTAERKSMQTLSMRIAKGKRRHIELNGVKIDRMSEMIGNFRAVLFCPEHLSLIKEGPSFRRNFLDVAISQFRPVYLRSLQRYNAILEQRNKLLKNAEEDRETLDSTINLWSEQLAKEAALICSFRYKYIKKVGEAVRGYFSDMTGGKEDISIEYVSSSKESGETLLDVSAIEKKYYMLLCANVEREICAGATLYGIHKDDIEILINGKSARIFGSQGQQRSLALALKLAEGDICFSETGDRPVLLLDDVLSELDEKRRKYLLSSVNDRQVIITTCENIDFGGAKKIYVEEGKYS